ncbi:hypothetical protein [Allobaculum stercoricanis]|uniref:hypothetical protein n=1 Tax=Allobaculum stercoricanis TaxID=174709 RepID=UPI00037FC1B7|nr:hypothetical protein [Allobaculum stercoricanis]
MNKYVSRISTLLVGALFISACATNTNTSSVSSTSSAITTEDSSQTSVDEIVIDQPVMKLETQGDVIINENECYERVRESNNTYYFQVLNRQISYLYPTVRQYKMDLHDGNISLIKERDPNSNERVWDFLEFNGVFYESVIVPREDNAYGVIYADGNEIWSAPLDGIPSAPLFAIDQGHLLFATSGPGDIDMRSTVCRINSDQTVTTLWQSGGDSGFTHFKFPTFTNDDLCKLVFQSTLNGKKVIVLVNSEGYETVEFDKDVIRLQPLKDKVFIANRKYDQPDLGETFVADASLAENEYHLLDLTTKEIVPIESPYDEIGNKNVGAGAQNSFLFIRSDDHSTWKAKLQDNQLTIEKLPDIEAGIDYYFRLNDKTALVNVIVDYANNDWSKIKFYLVNME